MNNDLNEWKKIVKRELPYTVKEEGDLLATMQLFYSLHYHQRAKVLWESLKTAKSLEQFQGLLSQVMVEFPVKDDWEKPVYPLQFKQTLPEAVLLRYKKKKGGFSLSDLIRKAIS